MSSPVRRSRRDRKANTRYAGADWDREALRRIRAASTSSGSSPSNSDIHLDPSEDYDFVQSTRQADEVSSDDEELSLPSDASSSASVENDDDDFAVHGQRTGRASKKVGPGLAALSSAGQYRGLKDLPKSGPNDVLYPLLFGPDQDDLEPILHVRERWLKAQDIAISSRSTLANNQSSYTFLTKQAEKRAEKLHQETHHGVEVTDAHSQDRTQRNQEASYFNLTMEANDADLRRLQVRQRLNLIDETLAKARQYLSEGSSHSVVHGALQAQSMSNVQMLNSCAFGIRSDLSEVSAPHQGWLLNVGEKVQALSWAPVLSSRQFLAVSTRCTPAQRETLGTPRRSFGPAFTPSTSYPSSIQLWSIDPVCLAQDGYLDLDMDKPPQLEVVIGTRCGDISCLEWAPVSSLNTALDAPRVLALLSSDSHVRILVVDLNAHKSSPVYLELETAAVDIRPPHNPTSPTHITGDEPVFTTICWASSRELLVGCSNGVVYGYNTLECIHSSLPQPWFCHPIHGTYVMAIAYANPMVPSIGHFLASSSAAGDLTLTDLRHPSSDTLQYSRARLPSKPLIWSPFARCWLTTYEPSARSAAESSSSSTIVCHHLRRFYSQFQVARLPPQRGIATALAGSIHHPCLLIGNAAGDIFATNYLRRILINRPRSSARGAFLQQISRYDWRPADKPDPSAPEADGPETKDLFHGPPTREGVSRLTFGFRPEPVDLVFGRGREPKKKRGGKKRKTRKSAAEEEMMDDGDVEMAGSEQPAGAGKRGARAREKESAKSEEDITAAEVIFEEEQAVTALEWNVNQRAAGWAAVGWGSGIVMVRDLSINA